MLMDEGFQSSSVDARLRWFCEPAQWVVLPDEGGLEIATDAATDFWQRTHYGFQADNGHFLHLPVEGDFVMETFVAFRGLHQYDQAGLLVRFHPDCWLKTSVEYEPEGANRLGAVVTRGGFSDWSTQDVDASVGSIGLRVTREGSTFVVEAAIETGHWSQIRLAHLDGEGAAMAGLYACSPKGAGFRPRFRFLRISAR